MSVNTGQERELGWDDEISKESEFQIIPAGDYNFTVVNFERGRHPGSQKLPPCNKAIVELRIDTATGPTTIKENFFLHTSTEGFLTAFFTAIGQKEKDKPVRMNWGAVVGATGRLKLKVKTWTGNDGQIKEGNEVQQYYAKEVTAPIQQQYQQQPVQTQQYQQPPVQQQQGQNQTPFPTQTQQPTNGGWQGGSI